MELKTNYQYTYFIYPFVVKENKYKKYILKLLKDKNCNLKTFQKEKDLHVYKYFSPKVREFMFSSFSLSNTKIRKLEELPIDTRVAMLSGYPCSIFEYNLEKDIQGKTQDESSIFFKIQRIEVICFNNGICFLAMKTNIENSEEFTDILNFNYKFRNINQEGMQLNGYDNIKIQLGNFSDVETFLEFIRNITGSSLETIKLGINTERFLTYSYVCIDGQNWNQDKGFETVQNAYIKYSNILSADNNRNLEKSDTITLSKWKYAKLGITKAAVTLFTSSIEMNNYTILPEEYEKQYFYTYILNLYKSVYLKKINQEFENTQNIRKIRKKFIEFTKNIWIQELTQDEIGNTLNHTFKKVLEIEETYQKIKNKYDTLYKQMNIENNTKITAMITVILVVSLILNILNFVVLIKG